MDIEFLNDGGVSAITPPGSTLQSSEDGRISAAIPDATLTDEQEDPEMLAEMHRLGELRWKQWNEYAGKNRHPHIAAWKGGFRAAWSACKVAMANRHGILTGEDAERFLERMANPEPISPETIARIMTDYEAMKRISRASDRRRE